MAPRYQTWFSWVLSSMDEGTSNNVGVAQWYYALSGQRVGPVDESSLMRLVAGGQVQMQTLVWTEGMAEWADAGSVPRLAAACKYAEERGAASRPPIEAGPVTMASAQWQTGAYAGFWLRFVASIIDGIVIWVINLAIQMVLGLFMGGLSLTYTLSGGNQFPPGAVFAIIGMWGVQIVVAWLYFAMQEASERQATLGKMALGLRVTTLDGRRITFARASGRYFGKMISSLTLLIGYIMAAFTAKKQALHDIMAQTLVVRRG